MEKKPKLTALILIIIYIILMFFFIYSYVPIGNLNKAVISLNKILVNLSELQVTILVAVIASLGSLISFLIQYVIAKFLFIIFSFKSKIYIYYALIPKSILMLLNIIFVKFFLINNEWFYTLSAFIASVFILLYFQYKNINWKHSFVFAAPFLIDSIISLSKYFM